MAHLAQALVCRMWRSMHDPPAAKQPPTVFLWLQRMDLSGLCLKSFIKKISDEQWSLIISSSLDLPTRMLLERLCQHIIFTITSIIVNEIQVLRLEGAPDARDPSSQVCYAVAELDINRCLRCSLLQKFADAVTGTAPRTPCRSFHTFIDIVAREATWRANRQTAWLTGNRFYSSMYGLNEVCASNLNRLVHLVGRILICTLVRFCSCNKEQRDRRQLQEIGIHGQNWPAVPAVRKRAVFGVDGDEGDDANGGEENSFQDSTQTEGNSTSVPTSASASSQRGKAFTRSISLLLLKMIMKADKASTTSLDRKTIDEIVTGLTERISSEIGSQTVIRKGKKKLCKAVLAELRQEFRDEHLLKVATDKENPAFQNVVIKALKTQLRFPSSSPPRTRKPIDFLSAIARPFTSFGRSCLKRHKHLSTLVL